MHSPFTFNPNAHRATSHYQQQSGHFNQPVYTLGAPPAYGSGFMSHQYVNHAPFTRSFASVVGCENRDLGMPHNNKISTTNSDSNNSPSILGSIFKHFSNKQTQPQYPHPPPPTQPSMASSNQSKEFDDFSHMPMMTVNNIQHYQPHYFQQPQCGQFYPSANTNNNNMSTSARNFMASFFGRCQQQHAPPRPRYPRWFNNNFRSRGGRGRHRNYNQQRFHEHDVNLPKNAHEKERSSIERDIHDDFVHIVEDKEVISDEASGNASPNNPNETAKGSCCTEPADDPPFMIYSLEEFPAIVTTSGSVPRIEFKSPTASPPAKRPEMEKPDEGFVVVPTSASSSTPSFTPKRISLCEKIIKSPTKLFPKPIPVALKPCLKAPRRRLSECSDDFIVFASDTSECGAEDISYSDTEDETDSETDDDDIVFEGDDDMEDITEEDGEESDDDEDEVPEQQLDSGVEEKRVSFTSQPLRNGNF